MTKNITMSDKVGISIDTNEWLFGVSLDRNLDRYGGKLLSIGCGCIILHIASVKKKGKNTYDRRTDDKERLRRI